MRQMIKFLLFSLVVVLLLSGCNSNATDTNGDIFQYKNSFVGDNNAVGKIANQLPATELLNGLELKTIQESLMLI